MKRILKIAVVVILVVVMGRSCVNAAQNRPLPSANVKGAQTTVIATRTPKPIYAPTPTLTPTSASTTVPVAEPAPAATAAPNIVSVQTREEKAYTDAMRGPIGDYSAYMQMLADQLTLAGADPLLVVDDDWRIRVAAIFTFLGNIGDTMRVITPPTRFEPSHKYIIQAADAIDNAIIEYSTGIDNIDADAMLRGNQYVVTASTALNNAAVSMQAVIYGN